MSWPRRPGCFPRFVAYLDDTGAEVITVEAALAWAQQLQARPGSKVAARRMTVARGFARHMAGIDPRTQVPPLGLLPYRQRWRPPFIYSDADIQALMAGVPRVVRSPLRTAAYQALTGLLAATGMRVGEALRLECGQVDWAEGVLTVHATKFGKSREVPLAPGTGAGAGCLLPAAGPAVPPAQDARVLRVHGWDAGGLPHFGAAFRRIIAASGVGAGSPVRPRVHDIRHSFAVHTLAGWYRAGEDVSALLPRLSTYLGTAIPSPPTGTCRQPRNCWNWLPPASRQPRRPGRDRAGSHAAAVLHRAAGPAAPGQPANGDLIPEHLPATAALPPAAHRQSRLSPGLGRPGRRDDLRVPGPPRSRTREHRPQPQRPAGRAALPVPLRGAAPPRARPAHPAGPGHPAKTLRPRRSRSSPPPKPARCWPHPTPAAGKDAATARCSPWPRRQACGYPS
jgi:integrase/recombinase XerD